MKLPLKWEFPGGKIENGEEEEDCIKREIMEELNITIDLITRLSPSHFDYPTFSIELIPFVANYLGGEIKLAEHKQYLLLEKEKIKSKSKNTAIEKRKMQGKVEKTFINGNLVFEA